MIGHDTNIAAFKAAFETARPHHAWLLTGPQGLGKALFARLAAVWVLAGRPVVPGFEVDPETPAARFVAAGSHIDFKIIERLESPTTGKLRGEITIEQLVRRQGSQVTPLSDLLQSTPALSDYRVVIIDAADDMNRSVANALLKNLEEPSPGTLFLLISHTPGRLLPTIRSRCRSLRFQRLPDGDVATILDNQTTGLDDDDRATLVRIAQGAPGRALRFAESGIAALEEQLAELAVTPPAAAAGKSQALARSLSGKANGARYEAFIELAPAMLAAAARTRRGPALTRALADWEAATTLAASAVALSMEPQAVAFDLAMKVAALGSR
jgi:DNA polymerase-3 subunit delta'